LAVAVVFLGLGAGAFLVVQRPSFWLAVGVRLGQALLPRTLRYLTRNEPPEKKAAWREAERPVIGWGIRRRRRLRAHTGRDKDENWLILLSV